jgi:subtilisin family serine protease
MKKLYASALNLCSAIFAGLESAVEFYSGDAGAAYDSLNAAISHVITGGAVPNYMSSVISRPGVNGIWAASNLGGAVTNLSMRMIYPKPSRSFSYNFLPVAQAMQVGYNVMLSKKK